VTLFNILGSAKDTGCMSGC